jgi:serine phosphatase RsbU (regulator of sigma subunit)
MAMSKKPTILCVDDEKIVLVALKQQLKTQFQDFNIEIAESAEDALEILQELEDDGGNIPLVVSDQIMPGLKGDEFLIKTHEKHPKTLKILLTGQASTDAVGNAVNKANLYRYIAKPWQEEDFILTVKEAVRSYFSQLKIEEQEEERNKLLKQLQEYNEQLEHKVAERTAELAHKNKEIIDSITYAQRIQQATLPNMEHIQQHLPNHFILNMPRDIVSGDFYSFHHVKSKEVSVFICADCTGHGVPGAFMSMLGMNQLAHIIDYFDIVEPHEILYELHQGIRHALRQYDTDNRDGMDISVVTINHQKKMLEFAGAMNDGYAIQDGQLIELRADKKAIGGYQAEEKRVFNKFSLNISIPTTIYLMSDGYADQFGGELGKKFMIKRLKELLLEIHTKDMNVQKEILENTIKTWMGATHEQVDDILLVGMRF